MKNTMILMALLLMSSILFAQESNNGKRMWAESVLNEKAPELVVAEWISAKPEIKGKFILIDFWATWCGPCRKAIPELNELQEKFKEDLVIIGLSDETADKVKAMTTPVISYYHGVDTQAIMKKALKIKGIPHVILIDPKGIVRWEGFPLLESHKLTAEVIQKLIEKYK